MAFSSLLLDIEENVKCPVCLEVFIEPVMLECQHSLCKRCLNVLMKVDRLNCPQCRTETTASKVKDFLLQKTLVEVFNKSQQEIKKIAYNRGKKRDAEGNIVSDNTGSLDRNDGMCDFCKSFQTEHYCFGCKNMVCKACQQCHKIFTHCKDDEIKVLSKIVSEHNDLLGNKLADVESVIEAVKEKFASIKQERQQDRTSLLLKVDEIRTQMLQTVNNYCESQKFFIEDATKDCVQQLEKSCDETVRKLEDTCRGKLKELKTKPLLYKPQYVETIVAYVSETMQAAKEFEVPSKKVVFQDSTDKDLLQFGYSPRMIMHEKDNKNQRPSLHQLTYRRFYLKEKIPTSRTHCPHVFFYQGKIWTLNDDKLEGRDLATLEPRDDGIDVTHITFPNAFTVHGTNIFICGGDGLHVYNGKKLTKLMYGGFYHCAVVLDEYVCAIRDTVVEEEEKIAIELLKVTEVNGMTVCRKIEEVISELPAHDDNDFTAVAIKGKLFVCSNIFQCIYETDLKTGKILQRISDNHVGLQFSEKDRPYMECYDDRYVLISGLENSLKLCDLSDPEYPVHAIDIVEGISTFTGACFVPDGRLICVIGDSFFVYD